MRNPVIRAWVWLLGLSLLSTGLALLVDQRLSGGAVTLAGAAILTLSWLKARVILSDYLGLRAAPFWRRGFGMVLAIYMLVLLGLYVAA